MLKKFIGKSGRRILKAIKKLSTRSFKSKRSENLSSWHVAAAAMPELEGMSLSGSLPSLDTRSIDTYVTYVPEQPDECASRCSHCDEENLKNENTENEMIL